MELDRKDGYLAIYCRTNQ